MECLLVNILLSGTDPHLEIDNIFLGNIPPPAPFLSLNSFYIFLTQMMQVPFNLFVSLELKSYSILFKEHTLWASWGWLQLVPHPEIMSVHLATKLVITRQTVRQQLYQSTWLCLLPTTAEPQWYLLSWTWLKSHCNWKISVTQVDFESDAKLKGP